MNFARDFKDDEDEPSLLEKIKNAAQAKEFSSQDAQNLQEEIQRVVKMFYLQMKVKGHLKPLKEDYFI
jgi:hypothetical protein